VYNDHLSTQYNFPEQFARHLCARNTSLLTSGSGGYYHGYYSSVTVVSASLAKVQDFTCL